MSDVTTEMSHVLTLPMRLTESLVVSAGAGTVHGSHGAYTPVKNDVRHISTTTGRAAIQALGKSGARVTEE